MQVRNPHSDTFDVIWHVEFTTEADTPNATPRALEVVLTNGNSSLQALAERVAQITHQPFGSIYIGTVYIKSYV